MNLAALIAATIIAFTKPPVHPHADRYAGDIVAVAGDDNELAAALTATGIGETHFDPRLEGCRCEPWECDHGKAAGIFQALTDDRGNYLGHTKAEICLSNRLATQLAGEHLLRLRRLTGSWHLALQRYIGAKSTADKSVAERLRVFDRMLRQSRAAAQTNT